MNLAITYFPRLTEARGQRVRTTWDKLVARLSVARVVAAKDDAPGLSIATFAGDRRGLANVERVYAVGLDLDRNVDWDVLLERFDAVDSFLHTTWSSTPTEPRARVFIRLSRPVTGDEYRRVYAACVGVAEVGGLVVDRAASDPSRFWFLPSTPPGGDFRFSVGRGSPVNVEGALAATEPPPRPAPSSVRPLSNASRYAQAALASAVREVTEAPAGTRNPTLVRAAFKIARFVQSGELGEGETFDAFLEAALAAGLSDREARSTIGRAFRARRSA